jgi:hypothetical protein
MKNVTFRVKLQGSYAIFASIDTTITALEWNGNIITGQESVAVSCEHCDKASGSLKASRFLENLIKCLTSQ